MSPGRMLRKAMDLHGRQVTSRMRVPRGRELYGRWFRDMKVDFTEVELDVPDGKVGPDGLTLIHLSDIHSGPYVHGDDLEGIMDRVTDLGADLIVLTGDFVNRAPEELLPALPALSRLRATGGVWAVLGNHDFWGDGDRVAAMLQGIGIRVLRNEGVDVTVGGSDFHLAGVDDWKEKQADLPRASRNVDVERLNILLSHCPQIVGEAQAFGYDLVLAGHTHGMQVRLPVWRQLASRLMHDRHDHGLSRHGETHLYISRGLGVVTLPWRYKCPPEVSRIRLRAAA